jgi:hypothetical protein
MPVKVEFMVGVDDYKGLLSSPPSDPEVGDRYIDSDDDTMYIYYSGAWQAIHVLTPAAPAPIFGGAPYGLLLALTYPVDGGG